MRLERAVRHYRMQAAHNLLDELLATQAPVAVVRDVAHPLLERLQAQGDPGTVRFATSLFEVRLLAHGRGWERINGPSVVLAGGAAPRRRARPDRARARARRAPLPRDLPRRGHADRAAQGGGARAARARRGAGGRRGRPAARSERADLRELDALLLVLGRRRRTAGARPRRPSAARRIWSPRAPAPRISRSGSHPSEATTAHPTPAQPDTSPMALNYEIRVRGRVGEHIADDLGHGRGGRAGGDDPARPPARPG